MKLVMVVTKLTGNEENDRARAQEYCRYAAHKGVIPVSAYLNFHGMFPDEFGGAVEHLLISRLAKQVDEIMRRMRRSKSGLRKPVGSTAAERSILTQGR